LRIEVQLFVKSAGRPRYELLIYARFLPNRKIETILTDVSELRLLSMPTWTTRENRLISTQVDVAVDDLYFPILEKRVGTGHQDANAHPKSML
jgi:hypothetical protein